MNTEVCQETNVPPLLLFQKEKEHLLPLPSGKVISSYLNQDCSFSVKPDSLIYYEKHKYSVPPEYIDITVNVKRRDEKIDIYYDTELIASHSLSQKRLNYDKDHYKALLAMHISDKDTVTQVAEKNLQLMDAFL